jgi:hypothetical protein
MADTALTRHCCGEQHYVAVGAQEVDQIFRFSFRYMLGHFNTKNNVEGGERFWGILCKIVNLKF